MTNKIIQTRGVINSNKKWNNSLTENLCSHDDRKYQQHETLAEWRHRYSHELFRHATQDTAHSTHK